MNGKIIAVIIIVITISPFIATHSLGYEMQKDATNIDVRASDVPFEDQEGRVVQWDDLTEQEQEIVREATEKSNWGYTDTLETNERPLEGVGAVETPNGDTVYLDTDIKTVAILNDNAMVAILIAEILGIISLLAGIAHLTD